MNDISNNQKDDFEEICYSFLRMILPWILIAGFASLGKLYIASVLVLEAYCCYLTYEAVKLYRLEWLTPKKES